MNLGCEKRTFKDKYLSNICPVDVSDSLSEEIAVGAIAEGRLRFNSLTSPDTIPSGSVVTTTAVGDSWISLFLRNLSICLSWSPLRLMM